jgi:CDP-glucose 4,6-dehydratase
MTEQLQKTFLGSKVLITGHTGFKGSWLSIWLSKMGAKVTGLSLDIPTEPSHFLSGYIPELLSDDLRLDIRNELSIKNLLKQLQPDFVFHLAAQPIVRRSYIEPIESWQINTLGTVNILEALRGVENNCTAIFITSDKCYDNVEWQWGYRETDSLGGPDPYSASKGAAELAIRSYVRSYFPIDGKVRIGIGRAGNVIGGGDWALDRIVPDCVRAWSRGDNVELRNPAATRPWQHVLEPISGYLNLAMALNQDKKLHGEPFNFGPPAEQNHSVGELVTAMSNYWPKVRWTDVSNQYGGPYESGLLKLNCDKALYHLKWRAILDFDETVRETALWYSNYYKEPEKNIADFSWEQINHYIADAKQKGMLWAQ